MARLGAALAFLEATAVRDAILRMNRATNRVLWRNLRKPPYMEHYKQVLDEALEGASTAIHLGAGGRDPATITTADLDRLTVYAVDPSEASLSRNPNPNRILAWGHDIPLPSESIDVVFSEHLMEHVEDPQATVAEAHRLLRPGGALVWVAPNLISYSGLATWLTPDRFHRWVVEAERTERTDADVFPTCFRINTEWSIRRTLRRAGFEIQELSAFSNPPGYTISMPIIHQLVCLWHVALMTLPFLRPFEMDHVVVARKPGGRALPEPAS